MTLSFHHFLFTCGGDSPERVPYCFAVANQSYGRKLHNIMALVSRVTFSGSNWLWSWLRDRGLNNCDSSGASSLNTETSHREWQSCEKTRAYPLHSRTEDLHKRMVSQWHRARARWLGLRIGFVIWSFVKYSSTALITHMNLVPNEDGFILNKITDIT